jgi:hypothetical protein
VLQMRSVLAACVLCASSLGVALVAPPCGAQIVVNEILGDPGVDWDGNGAVSSRDDEWVEIYNASGVPQVLDNYRLSDGGTTRVLRFGFSGTLAPGARKVVYGSTSVAWEAANGVSATGLSLNNTGDAVRLWHIVAPDTLLVDSYTYAGFEILNDRSVGRFPDGSSEWRLFDHRAPYSGTTPPLGTGCEPTPGSPNQCPTAVEPAPWTRVKQIYRGSAGGSDSH